MNSILIGLKEFQRACSSCQRACSCASITTCQQACLACPSSGRGRVRTSANNNHKDHTNHNRGTTRSSRIPRLPLYDACDRQPPQLWQMTLVNRLGEDRVMKACTRPRENTENSAEDCQLMQKQERAVWKVNTISSSGSRNKERGWKLVFRLIVRSSKSLKSI